MTGSCGASSTPQLLESITGVPVVIASEAKQSIVRHKERLVCFASLAMTAVIDARSMATTADMISRSRGMNCPRFASSFTLFENRGRREDRVRAAPAVSCAIAQKNAHTSIQVQRRASGLPCAMVLRRTSCSSRCANSFSHRCQRIDGWRWPGWARVSSADVTPATGDRTTRLGRTQHALRQSLDGLGTLPPKSDEKRV